MTTGFDGCLALDAHSWLDRAMKALVIAGPPAIGKSTVADRLATGSRLRAVIEADELRTQASRVEVPEDRGQTEFSAQDLQDIAATKAAIQLTWLLLKQEVQVIIPDFLGCEHAYLYREGLSTDAVSVVRLDADASVHHARNQSRPPIRQYTPDLLAFLRADARQKGHPDLVVDTTRHDLDETAQRLEAILGG